MGVTAEEQDTQEGENKAPSLSELVLQKVNAAAERDLADRIAPKDPEVKLSLHETFLVRMDKIVDNVLSFHYYQLSLQSDNPIAKVELLPEVRVFEDELVKYAQAGDDRRALCAVGGTAGFFKEEESGNLITQEEGEPPVRHPARFKEISEKIEQVLRALAVRPEIMEQVEKIIHDKLLPGIESTISESVSLTAISAVREKGELPSFDEDVDIDAKMSAFTKISFLSSINEWADQEGLPRLRLDRLLPAEYVAAVEVSERVPQDQIDEARATLAGIQSAAQGEASKSDTVGERQSGKVAVTSP